MFERLKRAFRSAPELASPQAGSSAADAKRKGDAFMKAGDASMAEQQYRLAIALDSADARAHFALGWALKEQGLSTKAISPLKAALAIDAASVDAHYVLATILLGAGTLEKGLHHLHRVLELQPAYPFAYRDLCLGYVRSGRVEAAEALVAAELARRPESAELHLLSGNLNLQRGRFDEAVQCYLIATNLDSTLAEAHHNRGLALSALGRDADALACHDAALDVRPEYAAAQRAKALLLEGAGRHADALVCYDALLHAEPEAAEHHFARGNVLVVLAQPVKALASFRRAGELDAGSTAAHANCAALLHELGRYDEALASVDRVLALDGNAHDAFRSRALVLVKLGRLAEAEEDLHRFLMRRTDPLDGVVAAATVFKDVGKPEHGLALYEEALQIDPDRLDLQGGYASLLHAQRRLPEALAAYDRSLQTPERVPEALNNRALILMDLGRHREALASLDEALTLRPEFENGHYSRGLCRLSLGDLEAGWQDYEWRWRTDLWLASQGRYGLRTFAKPRWTGQEPLAGKSILLHPEQGLGDTLQFSRFASTLQAMGANVVLEVQPPLVRLLGELAGVDRLVPVGEAHPDHDFHCPLMSLPLALGTNAESIPLSHGYLGRSEAHQDRVENWRERIGPSDKPRVGLVWSGSRAHTNDHRRSIPLEMFKGLLSDRHEYFCLQNEVREADEDLLSALPGIRAFRSDLSDFTETAALIAHMDVVVCVDTAVAHLAGALGKRVWLLLPANPDWRWMLQREDTPWYASMRLFRQARLGDWANVIDRVRLELDELRQGMAVEPLSTATT